MGTGVPNIADCVLMYLLILNMHLSARVLSDLNTRKGLIFLKGEEVVLCVVFVQCTLDVLTCIAMKENGHFRCMEETCKLDP